MELECPKCGEWLELADFQIQIDCPECQEHWIVDYDADFVDGMWKDHAKLISFESKPFIEKLPPEPNPIT